MTAVARVLIGSPHADAGGEPVIEIAETISIASVAQLHEAAGRAAAPLLWVLDANAVPSPGALPALIEAGHRPAFSLPVNEAGAPAERLLGRIGGSDNEAVLAAVRRRQVPMHHSSLVSLLVDRATVLSLAPPRPDHYGRYASTEWTARLLAAHPGVLVPASKVRAVDPPKGGLLAALRLMSTGTWRRGEAIRELGRALRGLP